LSAATGRAKLNEWPYISPGPVLDAGITLPSSLGKQKATTVVNPFTVVAPHADTKSAGRCFRVMPQSNIDKTLPGPNLDALTAERVFGWKNVHKHAGSLIGKKQDKAGHWRLAKVPSYSTNPIHAYSIEERMKQLGRLDRYLRELFRITRSKNIPSEWASPDQRCQAAIKAVRQYGQVIPLSERRRRG
jgi:hypothetical protein